MSKKGLIGGGVAILAILAGFGIVRAFVGPAPTSQTHVYALIQPQAGGVCTVTFTWDPRDNPNPTEGPTNPYWVLLHSSTKDDITWSVPDGTPGTYNVTFDSNNTLWGAGKYAFPVSDKHPQPSGPAIDAGLLCDWGLRKCPYPYNIPECQGYTGSKGTGPGDPGLGVHATK